MAVETAQDRTGAAALDGVDVTARRIEFRGGTGTLVGYLFLPPGRGPFPCMIDSHGSQPPSEADRAHPQTAAQMMAWGIAYFFPHRAGYGESAGMKLTAAVPAERGTAEHDTQMSARLVRECDDVIAALDALSAMTEIDAKRIGKMGSSLGGILTLLALARDSRFRCGLDFSGGASQWAKHPKIKAMILDAARKLTAPVCLIQPENDFNTAPTREVAALLESLGKPHQARVFPKWGVTAPEAHRFCAAGQQIWGPWVRPFLQRHL